MTFEEVASDASPFSTRKKWDISEENGILILAYMGSGKTEAAARFENVNDIDIALFLFEAKPEFVHLSFEESKGQVHTREDNPEYPGNFLKAVEDSLSNGKLTMVPFTSISYDLFTQGQGKKFKESGVPYILAFPTENGFEEYAERFEKRGNPPVFIERNRVNYPILAETFMNDTVVDERITLQPGQYLADALIENGFLLRPKSYN